MMKKVLKWIVIVLFGLYIVSQVMELYKEHLREVKRKESAAKTKSDPTKSIAYKMVKNAIKSATEEIEDGDDVEPTLDQAYRDADGVECVFSLKESGGMQVSLKEDKVRTYDLKKIQTGVYDTYRPNRYASAGYIIRMIDDGRSVEVTKGDNKTVFSLSSINQVKSKIDE